jgi:pimeloyl-ACP methyl ester carboxylesterase
MKQEGAEYSRLLRLFATPPALPLSEGEMNALKKADTFTVGFEGWDLPCYGWGEGRTVLLCHGWGSRAGHLALLARALAQAGFRAVAFDAPAHHSLPVEKKKEYSNMFEFGRAIARVVRSLGGVHAVFGHSLGAMASLFAMAAYPHLEESSFSCPKLVLASAPATTRHVIGNFCRIHSLDESQRRTLEDELQTQFAMALDDYDCAAALKTIPSAAMVIQGANDEYFALEETLAHSAAAGSARILVIQGCGHNRILASKQAISQTIDFLKS